MPQLQNTMSFDFINKQSSRLFLDVWGLALVFNLKDLSASAMQTIPFCTWANPNFQSIIINIIMIQAMFISMAKYIAPLNSFVEFEINVLYAPAVSLTEKTKSQLSQNFNCKLIISRSLF